jgi:hypothetical protein
MTDWFGRPLLHVIDVEALAPFYGDRPGFTSPLRYEENGRARLAQAERQGWALIPGRSVARERGGGRCQASARCSRAGSQLRRHAAL